MYQLEAVIAAEHVLNHLTTGAGAEARVVPLGARLCLVPMTDALFGAVADAGAPKAEAFWKLPAGYGAVLAACSVHGPVAYVEAEFFGGAGEQNAQVWDAGEVVLGPLHAEDGSPVSQALRRLGVEKGRHQDEFDAVGLDRHRHTDDW